MLVQALEDYDQIDFAAFGAGAMASQGPVMTSGDQLIRASEIAQDLAGQIVLGLNFTPTSYTNHLATSKLEVDLREPHFRISTN